jgi:hypothetical protein
MKRKTVNQLLEQLYERFSWDEINKSGRIKRLKDKLFAIKLETVNGGKVWVENTDEISNLLR